MNLKQLQYLVAVADEGGFRQGAARLRVAQPALSRQVQNLERELGLQLFDRNTRKVSPTPAGEAFLHGVRLVLGGIADSVRRARLASEGRLGRCVIAASLPSLSNGALSRAAERIATEHPEIELTILEADVPDHWEMLRRGQVDLALGLRPPAAIEGIASETLWADTIRCALVPVDHRFARRATVRLAELRDDPYLALEPSLNETLWTEMETALRRAGVLDGRTRMVGSASGVRTLVAAGKGWSLVSEAYLEHPPTGTAALLVEDFSVSAERAALWRADDERGVVTLVRDVLRAVIANAPTPSRASRAVRGTSRNVLDDDANMVPRSLELRHLEYLTAAVDAASIGRAAEELGIAQPVLSRQLKDLEQVVGVELLERGRRGVRATTAGEILVRDTRRAVEGIEAARQAARRAFRSAQGQVVVATISTPMGTHVVASVLGDCARTVPELEIEIVEVPSIDQRTALLNAVVDVGFCVTLSAPVDSWIEREHLLDDPIDCVLLSRDHPLAQRERVELAELASLPFLFAARGSHPAFHDLVMHQLARLDFASPVDSTFQSLYLRWARTAEGKGWCLGFRSQRRVTPRGTVAIGVDGLLVPWGMELIWRRGEDQGRVGELIDAFRRAAATERGRASSCS
ncbi:MAG: LysR substrate-binding domain-containing protein [Gemmatimonadaceae bacterium]